MVSLNLYWKLQSKCHSDGKICVVKMMANHQFKLIIGLL